MFGKIRIRTCLNSLKLLKKGSSNKGVYQNIAPLSKSTGKLYIKNYNTKVNSFDTSSLLSSGKTTSFPNSFKTHKETPTTFFTTSSFKKNSFGKSQISSSLTTKRFYGIKLPKGVQMQVDNAPTGGIIQNAQEQEKYLKPQGKEGDYDKRQFAYFVIGGTRFVVAAAARMAVIKLLYTWSVAKDLKALASIEVNVSNIPLGKTITVTWRGKPVFIRHRTVAEIEDARSVDVSSLRDKQTDEERVKDPNYVIAIAICTHLGCIPIKDQGNYNAFFCPCHGSHYDISGRIREGPAPMNLEVPPYQFVNEGGKKIAVIG